MTLPQGWPDVAIQLAVFASAYDSYQVVRGLVEGDHAQIAFTNGRSIISLERNIGIFFEPSLQTWMAGKGWLSDIASWIYVNSHFTVTVLALVFIYLLHHHHYSFVRNMLTVSMGIALVGYAFFPTAPPRFFPEWGFVDSVANFTGIAENSSTSDIFFNPFAAVPSMHVAFALMLGIAMIKVVRTPAWKGVWIAYPVLVTFVVLATGNHYWFDAALGIVVALVSALTAKFLARHFSRTQPITSRSVEAQT